MVKHNSLRFTKNSVYQSYGKGRGEEGKEGNRVGDYLEQRSRTAWADAEAGESFYFSCLKFLVFPSCSVKLPKPVRHIKYNFRHVGSCLISIGLFHYHVICQYIEDILSKTVSSNAISDTLPGA